MACENEAKQNLAGCSSDGGEDICRYCCSTDNCNLAANPSSANPSTANPSTANPSTAKPSTVNPSTAKSSTANPSTAKPSTVNPSTANLSTTKLSTANPSIANPSTAKPSTTKSTWIDTRHEQNCLLSDMMVYNEKVDTHLRIARVVNSRSAIRCTAFCILDPACTSIRFDRKSTCEMYSIIGDGRDTGNEDSSKKYYEISKSYRQVTIHEYLGCNENQEVGYSCQQGDVCCNIVEDVNGVRECENLICNKYITSATDYNYQFDYQLLEGMTRIEFSVIAYNDAHVVLTSSPRAMENMYTIAIGGWSNAKSVIRRCRHCNDEAIHNASGLVSPYEFTKFWISFENGLISVGRVGEDSFMEWQDPHPLQVNYIGFTTGYGSGGIFKFCH
ncbi:uncharacterized protein [Antedon mediterranea]|uniref:uncharacterized protein n=1 Tax=Antedon mediterranea TaxID=105859 RepID=UPI003AF42091